LLMQMLTQEYIAVRYRFLQVLSKLASDVACQWQ